jgi:hypothetical protein
MELRRNGVDVISLSVGEPDFQPPQVCSAPCNQQLMNGCQAVIDATAEAARLGHTKYTATAGTHELRTLISEHMKATRSIEYTPDQVLVSGGGKQSIYQVGECLSHNTHCLSHNTHCRKSQSASHTRLLQFPSNYFSVARPLRPTLLTLTSIAFADNDGYVRPYRRSDCGGSLLGQLHRASQTCWCQTSGDPNHR